MNLNEIELESFAKINLHLDITGKYENGYHELYSVFQLIDLSDKINIKISDSNTEKTVSEKSNIEINGNFRCRTEDNLIYRVITEFQKISGVSDSFIIDVDKRIPDGAGLGGGSSNAAFVLFNINKMYGFPLSEGEIIRTAEKTGSDVPFFLKAVTALVKGRGEHIIPLDSDLSSYFLVIVCPDFRISTKEAYNMYDMSEERVYHSLNLSDKEIIKLLEKKPSDWGFFNSFTPVLRKREIVYSDIFKTFNIEESEYYNITGSGSAVFGIFSNKSNALKAENILKNKYPFVWNGRMLAGKPLLDK